MKLYLMLKLMYILVSNRKQVNPASHKKIGNKQDGT